MRVRYRRCLVGILVVVAGTVATVATAAGPADLRPIPDKLVVLTFDDGNKSDIATVAPLLKEYGFNATFFITTGWLERPGRLTWDDLRQLQADGFELGNHSSSHPNFLQLSEEQLRDEIGNFDQQFADHGLEKPISHAYPGGHHNRASIGVLREFGYRIARRGCDIEYPLLAESGPGMVYDPSEDDPFLIPSTLVRGPNSTVDDLARAVQQAVNGKIAVLTLHGVPDEHPHCSTPPEEFRRYLEYLQGIGCQVIALRDLAHYVDLRRRPADPYAPIVARLGIVPQQLKCEYLVDPLGVDTLRPRFSWILSSTRRGQRQAAYQLLVASSRERLAADLGDVWDSGKVASDRSVHVVWDGPRLESGHRYWWKVRCWNEPNQHEIDQAAQFINAEVVEALRRSQSGPYSEPATFQMGKLTDQDWRAQWIASDPAVSSPLLRKEFRVARPVRRATATICGLGYYELLLNGEKVGDHVLDPGTTYYHHDEPFELRARVLYVTHDVTDQLQSGNNALGILLGHGWYSAEEDVPPSPGHRKPYSDRPRVILQLDIEYADGTEAKVVTDASFRTAAGPITYNDYSHGETYDARLEQPGWADAGFDDTAWAAAQVVAAPNGQLRAQPLPPIRVVQTIRPVRLHHPAPGVYVYDMGKNFSGWCRLRVRGPAGSEITLRHATWLHDDQTLDDRSNISPPHVARQRDSYILKGGAEEVWEPRFTLHGFRYVEVTGFPGTPTLENLEGRFVRTSAPSAGTFSCSNDLINQIHGNVRRSFACCLQSMPQDAMDRAERVAWMGDPGMVAEDIMYNYDTAAFWAKWVNDMRDSQKPNGEVPYVTPIHWRGNYSAYNLTPVWQSNYPLFVWYLYQFYGDERMLAEHYQGVQLLVEYFRRHAEEDVLRGGLGDHMEPQPDGTSSMAPRHTPAALTSTAYYYFDTMILASIAAALGKTDDAAEYSTLATRIRQAFNREFLHTETNEYATGSQTSNAVALQFGLVPEDRLDAVLDNLVQEIVEAHDGHLSTGIVGTNALEQVLPAHGRADVMYGIATQTTFPSWGHQVALGATSLWETWEFSPTRYSKNMKMLGSCEKFFFHDLAGIGAASPGFREITIRPRPVGELTRAQAALETVHGRIASEWHKQDGRFALITTVPVNTTARVHLPKLGWAAVRIHSGSEDVWRDGQLVDRLNGITEGQESDDEVVLKLGSGTYHFYVQPAE